MPPVLRAALAAFLLLPSACTPRSEPEASGEVVAVLDGREIRESDLDAWIREDLYQSAVAGRDAAAVHEFRAQALERMLDEQLIAAAAKERGVEADDLQHQETAAVAVADEEVATFYAENSDRMGGATLEQIAGRIREFLLEQKRAEAWAAYVSGLRERASLEVDFEAPRVDVAATGPGLGPDGAPVVIVEFSDFHCPYCQRVTPTLKALRERYPDQVRIVFRHFPLENLHPEARGIAEASVCADAQGRFWEFHDRAFAAGPDAAERAMAEEIGLDLAAFDACRADGRAAAVVQADVEAGKAAGVSGTPAFFVNGVLLSGAQPLDAFVRVVERELARAGDPASPGS